jgi:gamma-glutamyltranspeptidase/glutathione hydrolase
VNWNEIEKIVLLEKDASKSDNPNDDEDDDIITN